MNKEAILPVKQQGLLNRTHDSFRSWRKPKYVGRHRPDTVLPHIQTREYPIVQLDENASLSLWAKDIKKRFPQLTIEKPTAREIPPLYSPTEEIRLSQVTVKFTPDKQPKVKKEKSEKEILEEILTLTQQLVEHKTVTGNTEALEKAIEDILFYTQTISNETGKPYFARLFHTEVNNGSSPIPSIVIAASEEALNRPQTANIGHLDVIDGEKDEFKLQIKNDGTIRGRGVLDLKGPIAVQLTLLRDFTDEAIVLSGDEEASDYSAHALAQVVAPQSGIVNLDGPYADKLATGSKGCERFIVTATDINNLGWEVAIDDPDEVLRKHDSYPYQNTIFRRIPRIFRRHFPNTAAGYALADLYVALGKKFPNFGDQTLPWEKRTYVNSVAYGERRQVNAVSAKEQDVYSIRYLNPKELKAIYDYVNNWIIRSKDKYPHLQFSVKPFLHLEPAQFNWNDPFIEKWRKITNEVTGVTLGEERAGGRSDVEHFINYWPDIPIVSIQVPGSGFHLKYEETTINALVDVYKILKTHLRWRQESSGVQTTRRVLPPQPAPVTAFGYY